MSFGTPGGQGALPGMGCDFTFASPHPVPPITGLASLSSPTSGTSTTPAPSRSTTSHHAGQHRAYGVPTGMLSMLHSTSYPPPTSRSNSPTHTPGTRTTRAVPSTLSNGALSEALPYGNAGVGARPASACHYNGMHDEGSPTPPSRDDFMPPAPDSYDPSLFTRDASPVIQPAPEVARTGIPSPHMVVQPLFIDKIARDFALEEHHIVHLHTFAKVGSKAPGLSVTDLATRIYMLGAVFALSVERKHAAAAAANGVEDLPALFNDLKIRLEDGFLLTAQQRANILAITQNAIYQPHQLTFKTLFKDVERELVKQKDILRLSNIYGNPYREKQLNKLVRRVCSNVRNTFRADICDSITGDKRASLKDFSWTSAVKYKLGGPGDKLDVSYTAHIALLRRFALDNPALRGAAENEDLEAARGDDAQDPDDTASRPAKRKRTTRAGPKPRPAKGEDFWARVDEHFAPKIKDWGAKITSDAWKSYLEQVVTQDERNFPHAPDLAVTFSSSSMCTSLDPPSAAMGLYGEASSSSRLMESSLAGGGHAPVASRAQDLLDLL